MLELLATEYLDDPRISKRQKDGKWEIFFQSTQLEVRRPSAVQLFLDDFENPHASSIVIYALRPRFKEKVYLITEDRAVKLMEVNNRTMVSSGGQVSDIERVLAKVKITSTVAFRGPLDLADVPRTRFNLRDYDFWLPGEGDLRRIRAVADIDPSEGFERQVRMRLINGESFTSEIIEGLRVVLKDGRWFPLPPRIIRQW